MWLELINPKQGKKSKRALCKHPAERPSIIRRAFSRGLTTTKRQHEVRNRKEALISCTEIFRVTRLKLLDLLKTFEVK